MSSLIGCGNAAAPSATASAPAPAPEPVPAPAPAPVTAPAESPAVRVNGAILDAAQLAQLQAKYRVPIAPGDYWYDSRTGLWGESGGPARGLIMPGESLGGALAADASGKGTGVFINGRELHPVDVQNLDLLFAVFGTRTLPGRYWSNADGNFGAEGSPAPMGNFRAMVAMLQRGKDSSHYKNNPWSYTSDYTAFGSGGGASYYESKKTYGPDKGYTGVYVDESGSVSYDTPSRSD
jgi:hypothetical protein